MKAIVIQFLLVSLFTNLWSQNPEWRYYSNSDKVNKFIETKDAWWQGTEGGLIKTDKSNNKITRFDRSNSLLIGNSITGLALDAKGDLWVSSYSSGVFGGVTRHTDQGIERMLEYGENGILCAGLDSSIYYLNSQFLFHYVNTHWDTLKILPFYNFPGAMAIDPTNGDLWFTTYTFGQYAVTHYNGITAENFGTNEGLPFENPVNQPIAISKKGEVYVGTSVGIFKKTGTNWTNIRPITGNEIISAITFNDDDVLYACIQPESEAVVSFIKYENNQWTPAFDGPIISYFGYTIKEISFSKFEKDKLILPSAGYGCWQHKDNSWTRYDSQSEIAEVRLSQLSKIDNNMWVVMGPVDSYDSVSIIRHDGKNFSNGTPGLPPKLTDFYFKILGKDAEGRTWARSQYFIYRFENNSWIKDTIEGLPGLVPSYLDAITASPDGKTVLYHNSLAYLKTNGVWNQWKEAPESTYETKILWDANGRLFVSYYNGWGFYDGTQWKTYNGFFYPGIKFAEAPNHDVYITTGYQVLKMAANSTTPVLVPTPSNDWFSMTIDGKGSVWLASNTQLVQSNGNDWISYDITTPGYIGGQVLNIEADNKDNIWIATYYNGLELFNPTGIVSSVIPDPKEQNIQDFIVFPNPSKGEINIQFKEEGNHIVELLDVNGIVLKKCIAASKDFQMRLPENITNGIYWLRNEKNEKAKAVPVILQRN